MPPLGVALLAILAAVFLPFVMRLRGREANSLPRRLGRRHAIRAAARGRHPFAHAARSPPGEIFIADTGQGPDVC